MAQAVRERRLARHRAKRLRRAIERMAQGDRVELYDLSFEEKTQVAVAGLVAVLLAAPLLSLLPRALRVTLLPAGALLALGFMLLAEIRSGDEQQQQQMPAPAPAPVPPPAPALTPAPTPTTAAMMMADAATLSTPPPPPLLPTAAAAPLRRPARAAIGPPYAIGGSRPKNLNGSVTELRASRPLPLPNVAKSSFIPLSAPLPDSDGDTEDPFGTLLSLQESDISLGISGSTYDIAVSNKSQSSVDEAAAAYDFGSPNDQIPPWIPSEVSRCADDDDDEDEPARRDPRDEPHESPTICLGDNAACSKSAFLSSVACRMSRGTAPNGVLSSDPEVFAMEAGPSSSAARAGVWAAGGSLRVQESSPPTALSAGGGASTSRDADEEGAAAKE